jgi:DNA-binding NarL/FixJ family response regulator
MNTGVGNALRILVADDHPIFRKGLRQVIESHPSLVVVGEASDGAEALRSITDLKPDLAILDIDMPEKNGLEVARALKEQKSITDIIVLTMYDDEEMFNEAMDIGVRGYVLKESAVRDIIESIRLVREGKHYISPSISSFLVQRDSRSRELHKSVPSLDDLTGAEKRILRLIADGKTSKEIASVLNVSPKTVDNHRLNISTKLNLRGSHKLLKFALQNKGRL